MVDIIINPGTGKVYGNLKQAEKNIKKFIEDTGIDFKSEYIGRTDNGRFLFKITNAKDTHEIEMVGRILIQLGTLMFINKIYMISQDYM